HDQDAVQSGIHGLHLKAPAAEETTEPGTGVALPARKDQAPALLLDRSGQAASGWVQAGHHHRRTVKRLALSRERFLKCGHDSGRERVRALPLFGLFLHQEIDSMLDGVALWLQLHAFRVIIQFCGKWT